MKSEIFSRGIRLDPQSESINQEDLIPCTIATSTPVDRYGLLEILDCSPAGVDLSRAPLPLIVAHDQTTLAVGLVENLTASGDKVTGQVRFGQSEAAQQIRADVISGIHRSLSVGYALLDKGTPTSEGTKFRWQPHEASIVSVPADPAAGFFRNQSGVQIMKTMTKEPNAAATEIQALCTRHRMPELSDQLIEQGCTVDQARALVLDKVADLDRAAGGNLNLSRTFNDGGDSRNLIVNTLIARMGGKAKGPTIGGSDCTALAVRSLELSGARVSYSDSRDAILRRAMTNSDFPALLGNAAGKVLLGAFEESPASLKQLAKLNNLPNFKDRTVIRLPGGAPSLEKVNESGEFKQGAMNEAKNVWRLSTYGRIVSLSRQAMVNDDLSAFAGVLVEFGRAAARREADELTALLIGNPLVDELPLFSSDRNSLQTGAGSALTLSSLSTAVKSLRLQREPGGGFIIHEPAFLVVPAALETTARQLTAQILPTGASTVQPYSLTVIVEPRLDAASQTAWFLVSGNQMAMEYGYLDGAQGPQTFEREGFEVDGMDIKCRLDFGSGWVSPIGWVKSNGA